MLLWDMLKGVKGSKFMKTVDKKTKDANEETKVYPSNVGEKKGWAFSVGKNFTSALYKTEGEARTKLADYLKTGRHDWYGSAEDSKDEKDFLTKDRVDLSPTEYSRAVAEEVLKIVPEKDIKKALGALTSVEDLLAVEVSLLGKLQNQEGMTPERAAVYLKQNYFGLTGDRYTGDPLTAKGEEIKGNMEKEYGEKKGEQVFYASKNKGTIEGVDAEELERCKECGKKYNPEKSDARDPEKFCSATCESSYPAGQAEYRHDMKQDR